MVRVKKKLSAEEFVKQAIVVLRDPAKSLGIHARYSGFEKAFLSYFGRPPYDAIVNLSVAGVISVKPARGGAMLYLAEEHPTQAQRHPESREIPVDRQQVEELRFKQIRHRPDWPAVFSCNRKRKVWVFKRWGYHQEVDRHPISHPLVDEIVDVYVHIRKRGGRFFVNSNGAYFRPQGEPLYWFVLFRNLAPTAPAGRARFPARNGAPR